MMTELDFEQEELNKFEAAFPLHEEVPEYDNHSPQRQGQWQGWLRRTKLGSQGTPPQDVDFREWAKLILFGLRMPGSEKLDSGLPHAAQKAFMEAELKSFANSFASSSQGTGWAVGVCRGCGGFVNSCGHSMMRVYSLKLNDGSGMSQTKCSLCEALPTPPLPAEPRRIVTVEDTPPPSEEKT